MSGRAGLRGSPQVTRAAAQVLVAIGTLAVLVYSLFPILWLLVTAFKPTQLVFTARVLFQPTLANFAQIIGGNNDLVPDLVNSIIIGVVTTAIAVPVGLLAAYAFSRYRFRGSRGLLLAIIATQFVPGVVIALPFLSLFTKLGLLDTRTAIVIVNLSIVVPYVTWLVKGFIDALPIETEEAAQVDGCTQLRLLWQIVVPLAAPGIFIAAIFAFILSWNDFLFPFFLARENAVTLPVGLMTLVRPDGIAWGQMAAGGLIVMVPMLALSLLVRRHFVRGITMGSIK